MKPKVSSIYTEADTERFYDAEDAHYRAFWDKAGSLHWGIFDESTGSDFLKACANLDRMMAAKAVLDETSKVIDLGCGNGTTATWLAETAGCQVVGVDLSGVRVQNAKDAIAQVGPQLRQRMEFRKASVTDLPFADDSFTHAWSQAVFYHVPDKEQALREAYRVLRRGGIIVLDDLIKPKPDVSDMARKYVYERLLFDTDYSLESYQEALSDVGFRVVEAVDLSDHLARSYALLAELAGNTTDDGDGEHFKVLSFVYRQMVKCIENQDVGWAMYVARK